MTEPSAKEEKIAIILLNLGGPDCLKAVKPFLFNLFYDPAIMALKNPLRWLAAKSISSKRAPIARKIYQKIGGKSPLLAQTRQQAAALEATLKAEEGRYYKCFIAMRYWYPFAEETVEEVKKFNPDRLVLLPLYPHYSITTVGSSLIDWQCKAQQAGLNIPYRVVKDYADEPGYIAAHVAMIREKLTQVDHPEEYRILYSAHGLPEKIIAAGDPFRLRTEASCRAIQQQLGHPDHVICFQSRVGPLTWIKPYSDDEINRAGADGKSVIVVPISFVSEHSETLVELDMDYREIARQAGVKDYIRVATVGCHDSYISALAKLTRDALK